MTGAMAARVDLDDCHVVGVTREDHCVVVELEQRRNKSKERIVVRAADVSEEVAEYYVGERVTAPHPDPTLPLDYIEYAEQGPGYLEFQGYLRNESWFVWRIVAPNIEIRKGNHGSTAT